MSWPIAFAVGALAGVMVAALIVRIERARICDEIRDAEWRSGWVAGARAVKRSVMPGALPLQIPPGVPLRALVIHGDED